MSTMPVAKPVRRPGPACDQTCSSTPSPVTPASLAGSSISGRPWSRIARITVCQPTPSSPANDATVCPALLRSITSRRARSVGTARGAIAADVSD